MVTRKLHARARGAAAAALVVVTVMGGVVPAQGAEVCASSIARTALEMRVLQSELMVAALTCNQRPSYNAFVKAFKPYLQKQGRELRTFFAKTHGPVKGPRRLDLMVTRLANLASQNSLEQPTAAYCAATKARFSAVLAATPQSLAHMARANATADSHGYQACVEVAAEGDAGAIIEGDAPGAN